MRRWYMVEHSCGEPCRATDLRELSLAVFSSSMLVSRATSSMPSCVWTRLGEEKGLSIGRG